MPNRLINETSPYLLQHAHNPVDWYPWGEEAFEKARREDMPVLVSIGYAACHWCHVMERESFEDPAVAALMNERFVNIKVDREERPDVDHIYMDAVQAISGSGGWPLNVFLTPDKRPFYGGTYYPPRRAFNRASWTEVLTAMSEAYQNRKDEVDLQASQLTEHLKSATSFGRGQEEEDLFSDQKMEQAFQTIMKAADKEWGGFGHAPKFPQSFTISFLLRYAHLNNNSEALAQARLSLDKMIQGGIYDQVGGGFARYATDTEWLVPHFEKMLYDNALLVITLSEAYQLTRDETYRQVMEETLAFVERELQHSNGGFYAALDADSEGEEGKFYVWEKKEVEAVLGEEAELFCAFYDITDKGNWEGKNIPRIKIPLIEFARTHELDPAAFARTLKEGRQKLLIRRGERVRPGLDDKIILGWNALMNLAYCKAYAATAKTHYREVAVRNMDFLIKTFEREDGLFQHTWKGEARHPAFLDDYGYLLAALMELAQVSGELSYLDMAGELTGKVLEYFGEEGHPLLFYTNREQDDIPLRKKEVYDGATPSGNAMMAGNLYRLAILFNKGEWKERSEAMIRALGGVMLRYPTSFGVWLQLLFEINKGIKEIVIIGEGWKNYLEKILGIYISHKLALAAEEPIPRYPFFEGKAENREIRIYLCKNYACRKPVNTIQEFVTLL